jgi:LmbE family N-acetylglucosaminyl deacetylase
VDDITFLEHRDGLVVADIGLRAELAGLIRRKRPEVVISINHRDSWGGSSWNHADHRAVGVTLLDAVRDAANPWLFRERGEPWGGVRMVAFNGSPQATHGVDVTDSIESGIESLSCHRTYLENLDDPPDVDDFLRGSARVTGERLGVELAVAFEVVTP